ncbi:hypothetical protein DPMN_073491 [Dreissena polymorpha]|uniref:Uncharacterized protein n=1 Tax=Dreissena polymorpha TaxID=45954 RepID=A0A9D4BZ63_DREPO|nr:hypothetical protein DPMN_073491 [Dreissena polymorpha]
MANATNYQERHFLNFRQDTLLKRTISKTVGKRERERREREREREREKREERERERWIAGSREEREIDYREYREHLRSKRESSREFRYRNQRERACRKHSSLQVLIWNQTLYKFRSGFPECVHIKKNTYERKLRK